MKTPILVILGPTASGKSGLAIDIALELKKSGISSEIISADSRQVYKGLDIGTGKVTPAEMRSIPHHLLDVTDPHDRFTVVEWKTQAEQAIRKIAQKSTPEHPTLTIICGGTGFYIDALIHGVKLPDVPEDPELRAELEEKSSEELMDMLTELDPARASTLDPENKRRIIRAIEIARTLGKVPEIIHTPHPEWNVLVIGVEMPDEELKKRIINRLITRIDSGMIEESKRLLAGYRDEKGYLIEPLSHERMNELGLEYRYLSTYLKSKGTPTPMTREDLISTLSAKIWQYARRQKTWFKRDKTIEWYRLEEKEKILEQVKKFIQN